MVYEHETGIVDRVDGQHYQHPADILGEYTLTCNVGYWPQRCADCRIACSTEYTGLVYGECDISVDVLPNNIKQCSLTLETVVIL